MESVSSWPNGLSWMSMESTGLGQAVSRSLNDIRSDEDSGQSNRDLKFRTSDDFQERNFPDMETHRVDEQQAQTHVLLSPEFEPIYSRTLYFTGELKGFCKLNILSSKIH